MAGAADAATTMPNLQDRNMRETGRYLSALAYQATAGEESIRCRIRCQQRLLGLLEEKYKAAFRTSTHDTDPGRCYVSLSIGSCISSDGRGRIDPMSDSVSAASARFAG